MTRLINPDSGTVVSCGDDLAENYRARGWADADALAQPAEAAPEKPQPAKRGRQKLS